MRTEEDFKETYARRDVFWNNVGKMDKDVMAPLINPAFTGGPRWPNLRQAFTVVRRQDSTIIASDGLSDPFTDPEDGPGNGFGLELYIETPGNLVEVKGSWQLDIVYQISQLAADQQTLHEALHKYVYLTTELYNIGVPNSFVNEAGRTGIIIGLQSPTVPSNLELNIETIDIVNVKLLTLTELEYVAKGGKAARDELAALFMEEANPTYSDLKRPSIVKSL